MSYAGYRLIVNGTTIYNSMIARGTYQFTKTKRMVSTWNDANMIEHQELLSNRKVNISFSLRVRTLEEQDAMKGIFALEENIPVTYWDDYDCTYKTGTFYMQAPKITHSNTATGDILYNATAINLVEY